MHVLHSNAARRMLLLLAALFVLPLRPAASDLQKSQKKELESAAKGLNAEAKSLDLALCYSQLGERQKAAEFLDQAIAGAGGPKVRSRLNQTRTNFTTAETTSPHNNSTKKQLELFDHLAETLGNGSTAEDELGDE